MTHCHVRQELLKADEEQRVMGRGSCHHVGAPLSGRSQFVSVPPPIKWPCSTPEAHSAEQNKVRNELPHKPQPSVCVGL